MIGALVEAVESEELDENGPSRVVYDFRIST